MSNNNVYPGTGGDRYVPYSQRTGNESIVYFTRDLSAEGLQNIYRRVNGGIIGKVGVLQLSCLPGIARDTE